MTFTYIFTVKVLYAANLPDEHCPPCPTSADFYTRNLVSTTIGLLRYIFFFTGATCWEAFKRISIVGTVQAPHIIRVGLGINETFKRNENCMDVVTHYSMELETLFSVFS